MFYTTMAQAVILYGLESWITFLHIGKELGGFQHRVTRRLTGRMTHQGREGTWIYPLLGKAMT